MNVDFDSLYKFRKFFQSTHVLTQEVDVSPNMTCIRYVTTLLKAIRVYFSYKTCNFTHKLN